MTARSRGFPWLAVVGSAVLALVLVAGVTVVLVWDRSDGEPERDRRSSTGGLKERLLEDSRVELPTTATVEGAVPGHDYTAAVAGVRTDATLAVPAAYDAEVTDPWQGAPGKIEVYADAGLTTPVPITLLPDLTSPDSDPHLAIEPTRLRRVHITRTEDRAKGTLADLGSYWNVNPTAYVVQHLTPDGERRARPLVTEVEFAADTPAPEQVGSSVTPEGDALLEWTPVAGAT